MAKARESMVSVRLGSGERELVSVEANRRGETVSQFVREAVLEKCGLGVAETPTYTTTSTAVIGLALERADDGQLIPKPAQSGMYISIADVANTGLGH